MKICVIPSWYPPNGGGFFQQQSEVLSKNGHEVTVLVVNGVSIKKPLNWLKSFISLFQKNYAKSLEGPLTVYRQTCPSIPKSEKLSTYIYALKVKQMFNKLHKDNPMEVIHVHSLIWGGYAAYKINKKWGIPYVVTEHRGRFVNNSFVEKPQLKSIHSNLVKKAACNSYGVYPVSSSMIPFLSGVINESTAKIGVLPNMVNIDKFQILPKGHSNSFTFFSLAGLVELKGFHELIKAFNIVSKKVPSAKLVIGGDGPKRDYLEKLTRELNLESKITFTGNIEHHLVNDYMNKADAFVLATRYEAFGVVYIEAMACGLPVVTTRAGGPESIISSDVGYLSEVGDIDELANNMIKMVNNYEQFDAVKIRQKAVEQYSEDAIYKQIIQILQEATENNKQ